MQHSIREILTNVLDIINYPDDKEAFLIEFGDLCINKALTIATKSLSPDKQQELLSKIKDITDPQQAEEIIGDYIAIEEYNKALEEATKELFENFLETVEPELTEEQDAALDEYLATIEN
jgi:hypothetical protein